MTKFKIGDRVRKVSGGTFVPMGHEFTITHIDHVKPSSQYGDFASGDGAATHGVYFRDLVLVGPVDKFYVFAAYLYDGGSLYGPFDSLAAAELCRQENSKFAECWVIEGKVIAHD